MNMAAILVWRLSWGAGASGDRFLQEQGGCHEHFDHGYIIPHAASVSMVADVKILSPARRWGGTILRTSRLP